MKLKHYLATTVYCGGWLMAQFVGAQGVVSELNNTGQTIAGHNDVTSWGAAFVAVEFQTGTNLAGYNLNTISTSCFYTSGDPINIYIMRADLLSTVIGPSSFHGNPSQSGGGLYGYTSSSLTVLDANTDYWLALISGSQNTYDWNYTATTSAVTTDGWSITGDTFTPNSTGMYGMSGIPMFAISATLVETVPEPTTLILLAVGSLAALSLKRKPLWP